mmetsp:Transcript_26545/g.85782  ORF Transcript_26545/g.85782 Transcript_26545/m.85782 type:complete len:217 (+) Transcript_26545:236-886(+)
MPGMSSHCSTALVFACLHSQLCGFMGSCEQRRLPRQHVTMFQAGAPYSSRARAARLAVGRRRLRWQARAERSRLAPIEHKQRPSRTHHQLTVRLYTTCDHVHRRSRTLAYTLAVAMAASDAKPFWKRNSMMPCFISDSTPLEQSTGCSSRTFREKGPNGPATEFALSTEGPKGASNFRISPTSSTSDVFTVMERLSRSEKPGRRTPRCRCPPSSRW